MRIAPVLLSLLATASVAGPSESELSGFLSQARLNGCAGARGTRSLLRESPALTEAARRVARGAKAIDASRNAGLRVSRVFHVSLRGVGSAAQVARMMEANHCDMLVDPKLTALGVYREGTSWWVMLAAPFETPDTGDA